MVLEIILYLFLLVAFIIFIKASEFKIFGRKLSLRSRLLAALVFPVLALFLFVFGIFILAFVVVLMLVGFLVFLFGGRSRKYKVL